MSKKFCQIFALCADGEIVIDAGRVETYDECAWRKQLEALGARYRLSACFAVGPHYEGLYDLLGAYCETVAVVNPAAFALIARSQRKTDKTDAMQLALGLRRGDLPTVYVPPKPVRADRRLVAFVHQHSQKLTRVKNKIRAVLNTHRLCCPYTDRMGAGARQWLAKTAPTLPGQARVFLERLRAEGEGLVAQRKALDARVARRIATYPAASRQSLASVPGVGPLTRLTLLSAIVTVDRFPRPAELASYFGVCGSVRQSAAWTRHGPITKRGNTHVRWLLGQVLKPLHGKDPRARPRYMRLRRKKSTGVARTAQMRGLATILWQLMKRGETYRLGRRAQGA